MEKPTPLHQAIIAYQAAKEQQNSAEEQKCVTEAQKYINAGQFLEDRYQGKTPLHEAIFANAEDIAEQLIQKKVDLNARYKDHGHWNNVTPLMLAEFMFRRETVRKLIDTGADTKLADDDGNTVEAFKNQYPC